MQIADLHIHSKYSRATSRDCDAPHLEFWARRKGITLLGTGDFTHPAWRAELSERLEPAEEGVYTLREECRMPADGAAGAGRPRFVLSGEISSIYKKNGRVRKVHNVILLPSLQAADRLAARLEAIGNIHSDGRPILGLDSRDLLEITLETCPDAVFIPAHIWTPHFSLFGAFSGFDTIEECFEDMTPYIHALETGLSSDPPMNWRLSALDKYALVSHSDAHSPQKLGREADLLDIPLSFGALAAALRGRGGEGFKGTVEFFPEEGKYHLDGHRKCGLCLQPVETVAAGGRCPVCGGKLTIGVLHRVEELADRPEGFRPPDAPPYESLVPLPEIIAACSGVSAASQKVARRYEAMLRELGNEFYILRELPESQIEAFAGPAIAEGIRRVREGQVELAAGYDGEYGKVKILDEGEIQALSGQMRLFPGEKPVKKKARASLAGMKKQTAAEPAPAGEEKAGPLAELNDEQEAAAASKEAVTAVVAGPGTGKTKTLIARIAWLLEQGVKPGQITAVTFTNKAAEEMAGRLEACAGRRRARAVSVGTFHAICLHILEAAGLSVRLADEAASRRIAAEAAAETGCKWTPARILRAVSAVKNGLEAELPAGLYKAYNQRLQAAGYMDFDDLLLAVLKRFEKGEMPAGACRPFTHLLVDEFQDINPVQYRLVRAWSREGKSLFVIGDPDQSIYGFRGADSRCFARLQEELPQTKVVRLVRNYRSTPEIIGCALPAISRNPGGAGERVLEAQGSAGGKVRLLTAADGFAEALFVAKEIGRMVGGMDMLEAAAARPQVRSFGDIAVLYRTHKQAELLEQCLSAEDIPYIVRGRDDYLLDPAAAGLTAYFRWLLDEKDGYSLHTALTCLFGLSEEEAAALCADGMDRDTILRKAAETGGTAVRFGRCTGIYKERAAKEKPGRLLENLAADLELAGNPAVEKLERAALFYNHMDAFLQNLTLGAEGDISRSGGKTYTADAVTLMTLHGAKGLEYPAVFLCGLRKGVLPLERPGQAADIEEERRLFYVGLTRAKEELILLAGREPSPFLCDLPEALLERGRASEQKQPYGGKQLRLF